MSDRNAIAKQVHEKLMRKILNNCIMLVGCSIMITGITCLLNYRFCPSGPIKDLFIQCQVWLFGLQLVVIFIYVGWSYRRSLEIAFETAERIILQRGITIRPDDDPRDFDDTIRIVAELNDDLTRLHTFEKALNDFAIIRNCEKCGGEMRFFGCVNANIDKLVMDGRSMVQALRELYNLWQNKRLSFLCCRHHEEFIKSEGNG